ncbi:MAG: hypothetical protein ACLVJB_09430 [Christensenellales bacterium]
MSGTHLDMVEIDFCPWRRYYRAEDYNGVGWANTMHRAGGVVWRV